MIDWPEVLVRDIARRRTVVVIGSGVSRHSSSASGTRPPTWKVFLMQAVKDCPQRDDLACVEEAIENNDLLHACEWLRKRYDESWVGYLRKTFSLSGYPPAEIHENIFKLDSRLVFSLNFDDIYERYANGVSHGSHFVKNYYDVDVDEFLRGDGRYVVKVHGNLSSPENLIFSQKDYSRARIKFSSFYQAFDAALLTHTFLFIGSGYNDPDINLLLENQRFDFPTQSPHYFLVSTGMNSDRRLSLRENRNLKVLEYDPIDREHSGLVEELKILTMRVEAEMQKIAYTASW